MPKAPPGLEQLLPDTLHARTLRQAFRITPSPKMNR